MAQLAKANTETEIVPTSWDGLNALIATELPGISALQTEYRRRTIKIGFAILQFSERVEVIAEVAALNDGARGAPVKPLNYVASRLSEKFGDQLPSTKHLQMCARCAEALREKGQLSAYLNGTISQSIRDVLGWTTAQGFLLEDSSTPTSQISNALGSASNVVKLPTPMEFSSSALSCLEKMQLAAQEIAAKKPEKFDWSHMTAAQRDELCLRVEQIDKCLSQFYIRVRCELKSQPRKNNKKRA